MSQINKIKEQWVIVKSRDTEDEKDQLLLHPATSGRLSN